KRPVFSQAYLLRSQINTALGKQLDAVEDAKKAYQTNPIDGSITRNYAFVLYERNQSLGTGVSVEQAAEMRGALDAALRTNPTDVDLGNFYADYISDVEPERAIAICQQIQKFIPTVENSLKLAGLALKLAEKSTVKSQKDLYISIAQNAYEKAYETAPADIRVLTGYSEFLRDAGRTEDAEKILAGRNDVLWRFYIRSGKTDDAERILTQLYEANPKDANVVKGLVLIARTKKDHAGILKYTAELLKLDKSVDNEIIQIETYLDMGIVDDAQEKLASLRERYPDEPRAMFLQAWLLAKQGKLNDALKLANRNLEFDKNNGRAWQLRGQINLGLNNFNNAVDDFQKSKTLQDGAEVRIDLAKTYIRIGREEQAIVELKTAIDKFGSAVARNMLEEVYIRTGKQDSLQKFYVEAIQTFPNSTYWYNRAGGFLLARKDFDNAYKVFDTALQNSLKQNSEAPDFQAFDGKLRTLLAAQKYDQLLAEATKYLDGPVATIAYASMAAAKAKTGDQSTAVQYFRRALEKAGTNEGFVIEVLRQMSQTVGFDETVKWCNEKLQTQPDSLAVNFALYNLHGIAEEYNKALKYVDECIRLASDNEQAMLSYQSSKAVTLYSAFQKTGDKDYLDKTIQEYESILQKQPTNISVLNNVAYMLVESGENAGRALEYAQKAYDAMPGNANVLDTYGYVLLKNENAQKADEILQRALQQFEQNKISAPTEVYEHVGMAKERLGQDAEALTAYKMALELADENVSKDVKDRISASIEKLTGK
ncbi:MAG: tetratricopeptide repeat protein, partial [Phycisphaerae bacterium]|nr:tetratricopeptide repeat protein [Phycisphaerae bacterium]